MIRERVPGTPGISFVLVSARPVDLLTATIAFLMATLVTTAVLGSSLAVTSLTYMYLLVLHPHGAPHTHSCSPNTIALTPATHACFSTSVGAIT